MENPETLVEKISDGVRITVCNTLSISTGIQYEQYKPFYSIQEVITNDSDINAIIEKRREQIDSYLKADYEHYHDCRSNNIPAHHRIVDINGVKYPSVTTIINPEKPAIPNIEEHGLIGTAFDTCMKRYIETGKLELGDIPLTPNVKDGWESVFESVKKMDLSKFKFTEHSTKIQNDEFIYIGELDAIAEYEGMKAIVDFKKTKTIGGEIKKKYLMQLSAYAKCVDDVDCVIILNPYSEPIIEFNLDKYFSHFLIARGKYKKGYGI